MDNYPTCEVLIPSQKMQLAWDIMTTAIERGINYWAEIIHVERNKDLDVIFFMVNDRDDILRMNKMLVIVDSLIIEKGMRDIAKYSYDEKDHGIYPYFLDFQERIKFALKNPASEQNDFDVKDVDMIVQWAIFGKLVYS